MNTVTAKERPILFSSPMIRAILAGRKTQTRRAVKFRTEYQAHALNGSTIFEKHNREIPCPYGAPGDRLWVRESWDFRPWGPPEGQVRIHYAADGEQRDFVAPTGWHPLLDARTRVRPSIHMPRWACRIVLEVVSVRVERLQDIAEADAIAEGVQTESDYYKTEPTKHLGQTPWHRYDGAACAAPSAVQSFQSLWESINGPGSWKSSPWVWVVEFTPTPDRRTT